MRLASLALALSIGASATALAGPNLLTNGNFSAFSVTTPTDNSSTNLGSATAGGMPNYNISVNGWVNAYINGVSGNVGYNFLYGADTGTTSGTYADNGGANGNQGVVQMYGPGNGSNNGLIAPTAGMGGGNILAGDGAYQMAAVYQTVNNLLVGMVYHVGFYYAGAQQSGFTGATTETWSVSTCAGTTYTCTASYTTPTVNNAYEGFTGWQLATFTFTATSTQETLSFLASGTPTGQPPFALLADVTLTVPEPSALGLFGLGVLGIAALRLRRMAKDRAATA